MGELNPWALYPQILESPILEVCQFGVCLFPCLFLQCFLWLFVYVCQSGGFGITDSVVLTWLGLLGGKSVAVCVIMIDVDISSCDCNSDAWFTVGIGWCVISWVSVVVPWCGRCIVLRSKNKNGCVPTSKFGRPAWRFPRFEVDWAAWWWSLWVKVSSF